VKLLIDLDDTLVNTTSLNNDAYNYALEKFGLSRIAPSNRITRDILSIDDEYLFKLIIQEKQRYFTSDWLSYRTILNSVLIEMIKTYKSLDCYLWTKANESRTIQILDKYNLSKYFKNIIFDNKISLENSILNFQTMFNDKEIIIYENNHNFFESHEVKVVDKIKNQFFDVKGYKISI